MMALAGVGQFGSSASTLAGPGDRSGEDTRRKQDGLSVSMRSCWKATTRINRLARSLGSRTADRSTASGFGGIRNGSNAESTDLNALQRAKAAGVYKGREVPVREMKVRGLAAAIATALGIGLASVYRVLVHCA
jgi:hypothetical protein